MNHLIHRLSITLFSILAIIHSPRLPCTLEEEKVKVVPYNPASTDQHWVIVGDHIENRYNKHLVIDLKGEHTMNNTSLIKYHFHGGDNQRWKFEYVD